MRGINEAIAMDIMKWRKHEVQTERWITPSGLLHQSYWYPVNDISQAFQAVNSIVGFDYAIERIGKKYYVEIYDKDEYYIGIDTSPSLAICKALIKYKDMDIDVIE